MTKSKVDRILSYIKNESSPLIPYAWTFDIENGCLKLVKEVIISDAKDSFIYIRRFDDKLIDAFESTIIDHHFIFSAEFCKNIKCTKEFILKHLLN